MRLTLCFVTVTTAQFSHTNDLRSRIQEEIAESIVDVAQQIESSYDATIRTCLIRKKSHGPRNQVFFNICHLVASLKLTLKRGYYQTMPIVKKLACRGGKLNQAFIIANKYLIKFCHQNKWKLIRHQNITYNGLNKGELHLNFEGNERL